MHAFFDGKDVSKHCVPKMLEISMLNGTFEVGETVDGIMISNGLDQKTSELFIFHLESQKQITKKVHTTLQPNCMQRIHNVRIIPDNYSSTSQY